MATASNQGEIVSIKGRKKPSPGRVPRKMSHPPSTDKTNAAPNAGNQISERSLRSVSSPFKEWVFRSENAPPLWISAMAHFSCNVTISSNNHFRMSWHDIQIAQFSSISRPLRLAHVVQMTRTHPLHLMQYWRQRACFEIASLKEDPARSLRERPRCRWAECLLRRLLPVYRRKGRNAP